MFHFHLTSFWFNEIKYGNKRCEYRLVTPRLARQVEKQFANNSFLHARFYNGYPKSLDSSRILDCDVKAIAVVRGCDLPDRVRDFFKATDSQLYYQFVFEVENA